MLYPLSPTLNLIIFRASAIGAAGVVTGQCFVLQHWNVTPSFNFLLFLFSSQKPVQDKNPKHLFPSPKENKKIKDKPANFVLDNDYLKEIVCNEVI